jgi:hypothetical protein
MGQEQAPLARGYVVGAYGHELTFDEMQWLANWLLVRGCNLLIPHAFYYSVRGPRKYERPPDVGPNSAWWGIKFTSFADACRRLCWLNTDSQHICHVAILGENHALPWRAAKVCFENHIDFNYLDIDDFCHTAEVTPDGIFIASQHYGALIVDGTPPPEALPLIDTLDNAGRLVRWQDKSVSCLTELRHIIPKDIQVATGCSTLRVRHVRKANLDWYILFNEGAPTIDTQITFHVKGTIWLLDPITDAIEPFNGRLQLARHDLSVLVVETISRH